MLCEQEIGGLNSRIKDIVFSDHKHRLIVDGIATHARRALSTMEGTRLKSTLI